MMFPLWLQIVFAALSGGVIAKVIDLIAFREKNVYHMMGVMQARIETLESEVRKLRDEKHDAINQLNAASLERMMLQMEINDLYKERGQAPKFPELLNRPIPAKT